MDAILSHAVVHAELLTLSLHEIVARAARILAPLEHSDITLPLDSRDIRGLFLRLDENGIVTDVSFQGSGCAISTASTSMMTQVLKGKSEAEARELFDQFHELIAGEEPDDLTKLGKLAVFAGVRDFPNRVKCATLAWHTMKSALDRASDPASTE